MIQEIFEIVIVQEIFETIPCIFETITVKDIFETIQRFRRSLKPFHGS